MGRLERKGGGQKSKIEPRMKCSTERTRVVQQHTFAGPNVVSIPPVEAVAAGPREQPGAVPMVVGELPSVSPAVGPRVPETDRRRNPRAKNKEDEQGW